MFPGRTNQPISRRVTKLCIYNPKFIPIPANEPQQSIKLRPRIPDEWLATNRLEFPRRLSDEENLRCGIPPSGDVA
jgi:hypothetical protein